MKKNKLCRGLDDKYNNFIITITTDKKNIQCVHAEGSINSKGKLWKKTIALKIEVDFNLLSNFVNVFLALASK